VGRLDKASEGLLLLTNDSEWASRITAPETHLEKIYHVQVKALVDESFAMKMVKGIRTSEGEFFRAKKACVLRESERNTWLEIILDEGKNRQIRRMLEHFGIEILRLVRVAIGPVKLAQLAKGKFRPLIKHEKLAIDQAIARKRTSQSD
jgi:23S rRNA pseudouridine2605 synthase